MRSRNIKPQFFKNEELSQCSFEARLLFIGLWCLADWTGRLERRTRRIMAEVFPYDRELKGEELLRELETQGLIKTYGNGKYLHIPTFEKHQNCHHKERGKPSTFPDPCRNGASTVPDPS